LQKHLRNVREPSGDGGGTYPPGWDDTPTPTVTPPEEVVTTPTKPVAEETPISGSRGDADQEEGHTRLHSGLRNRWAACNRLCDDAAQRVGGSTGDDERREQSLHCFLFCVRLCVRGQTQVSKKREIPPDLHSTRTLYSGV